MLDVKLLSFIALCQLKSFTAAAAQLNVTQPAVTQHIKALEAYYGTPLIREKRKNFALTEQGEILYRTLLTINTDLLKLEEQLRGAPGTTRTLSFGATLTIGEFVMPGIIAELLDIYPKLQIRQIVDNTKILLEKLESGDLEFVAVEGFFDKIRYGHALFSHEPFIAVCSGHSDLVGKTVTLTDLIDRRFIVRERGSGTRDILEQVLYQNGFLLSRLDNITVVSNMNAIKLLVAANKGISFMYRAAARDRLESGELCEIRVKDFHITREFNFVYMKNSLHAHRYARWFDEIRKIRTQLNMNKSQTH
ncbi:LysR family transcriptional regulator [Oscillospiraceae bacterium OttesenSCG-928-F05]|nr:LysR family transcriptional regulator [Oscillospiraceae bacterium OttesenSCG-928-F05]